MKLLLKIVLALAVLWIILLVGVWRVEKRPLPAGNSVEDLLFNAKEVIAFDCPKPSPTKLLAIKLKRLDMLENFTWYAVENPVATRIALEWQRRSAEAVAGGFNDDDVVLKFLDPKLLDKVQQAHELLKELD